ncbi:hypothetical protein CATMIT_01808, partial [Catenibacterium mitsuokai DSM 15897]
MVAETATCGRPESWRPKRRAPRGAPRVTASIRSVSGGFADHDDLDRGFDVGVQVQQHVVFAGAADRAFAHDHFRLADLIAGLGQRFGDVAWGHRAVQLAFGGGVGGDGHLHAFQLGLAAFGAVEQRLGLGFVIGAAGFELGQVGGGGRHGLALRNQVVAAVARLHVDLVAE